MTLENGCGLRHIMEYPIIKFALNRFDKPKTLILTESEVDNYLNGEQQYGIFELVGYAEISEKVVKEIRKCY